MAFPDVPEAITHGDDEADAVAMAEDALALGLLSYPQRVLPLPEPQHRGGDLLPIYVRPEDAAKLALLDAWRQLGITESDIARRIGKDEKEVRRMLDPTHATKFPTFEGALRSLGRRQVIGVEAA